MGGPGKVRKARSADPGGVNASSPARAGRVTGIEPQAKHTDRYNLYVDGRFAMGLSAYVAAKVRIGQEVSTEELSGLEQAERLEEAHDRALGRLQARPRSEAEIRRYLSGKRFSEEIIDCEIDRLRGARLLSDGDFARFWVENREFFRPRSAKALKYELRQKGVPQEEIARAVSNLDEADSAYRAARSKAERWKELDAQEFRAKLSGYLTRRGFGYQVTRDTATRIWKEIKGQDLSSEES
jgi:regulatory protein